MSDVDFKEALREAGIPTNEAELKKAWEQEVIEQGSKLSNSGPWSPFWRVITALITKPVLWLIDFIIDTVLPNFFVKTAVNGWLDMLAWAVNIERKKATKAQGELLFTRSSAAGVLDVEVGTRVQSAAINGHVYELQTTAPGRFVDGQLQLAIPVEAVDAGSGFNLAPGYYAIMPVPIPGIVQVVNTDHWLTSPGDDREPNDQLRLRTRNQFSAVNQYYTDAVYRAMITNFPGVRPDGVFFEYGAPRGPGSANAFVLFEAGVPANEYLVTINAYIREQGNHGHGDDLQVMNMPETRHDIVVRLWPQENLNTVQRVKLQDQVGQFIRAAFRESTASDYQPTLTMPQSRFSFSRLGEELHAQFPRIESLDFANTDILSELNIPRIHSLEVILAA